MQEAVSFGYFDFVGQGLMWECSAVLRVRVLQAENLEPGCPHKALRSSRHVSCLK